MINYHIQKNILNDAQFFLKYLCENLSYLKNHAFVVRHLNLYSNIKLIKAEDPRGIYLLPENVHL